MPTAAAIGTASSDTTTANTTTSASTRSLARISGLRPNSRIKRHRGKRTVKVSIAASSSSHWPVSR